ncbi:MAG: hypothetical protein WCX65_14295 [bacterium]
MNSGRKWFFLCLALMLAVGFLSGIIVSPLIMRPVVGHMMGAKRDRGAPPMGFGMGPGRHEGSPRGPMGDKGMGEGRIKNFVIEGMSRELSLSAEQKKQLKKIFDENEPEQLAFHKDMQKQMEGFRRKMDAQILKILDDKQKAKFKEFTRGFKEDGRHFPPGGDGNRRDMGKP